MSLHVGHITKFSHYSNNTSESLNRVCDSKACRANGSQAKAPHVITDGIEPQVRYVFYFALSG